MKRHGRTSYYLVGEGYSPIQLDEGDGNPAAQAAAQKGAAGHDFEPFRQTWSGSMPKVDFTGAPPLMTQSETGSVVPANAEAAAAAAAPPFRFGRMFAKGETYSFDALFELGEAMIQKFGVKDHSTTPAGYTFLGQFIDHDLAFDSMRKYMARETDEAEPEVVESKRTPSLDLDGLYGYYPDAPKGSEFDERLYEADGVRFKIGCTSMVRVPWIRHSFPFDLPRESRIATIGDDRNDENLALAQTTLVFLKFHNACADLIENQSGTEDLFMRAREMTIRHYQWVVLHDFLPRIVDPVIYKSAVDAVLNGDTSGRSGPVWLPEGEEPFMPVEFSVAGFRIGHSLLQDGYEWNTHFETPRAGETLPAGTTKAMAAFGNLFQLTGSCPDALRPMEGFDTLPSHWMIDWTRFYEFDRYGVGHNDRFNYSRKIDPFIGNVMKFLFEFYGLSSVARNLAIRNLVRGALLRLPSGQDAAAELVARGRLDGSAVLTSADIEGGAAGEILVRHGMADRTPLWYYILREAEVLGNGQRLGPVGSCIVVDTIVALLRASRISILRDGWSPAQSDRVIPVVERAQNEFDMSDLIVFAHGGRIDLLNPSEGNNVPRC